MGFTCGIVGLPNVGKSTLFNALSATAAAEASNYPFCTIEPNVGTVTVPDPRLDQVAALAKSAKLAPADAVVIHDEIDLRFAKVRVKRGGGHAGHNGLRNIDAHIGPDYWRVRVGVGHPGAKHLVYPYLLKDFAKPEAAPMQRLIEAIAEAWPLLVDGDANSFMSKVVLLTEPPKPKVPPPAPTDPATGAG